MNVFTQMYTILYMHFSVPSHNVTNVSFVFLFACVSVCLCVCLCVCVCVCVRATWLLGLLRADHDFGDKVDDGAGGLLGVVLCKQVTHVLYARAALTRHEAKDPTEGEMEGWREEEERMEGKDRDRKTHTHTHTHREQQRVSCGFSTIVPSSGAY